MSTLPEEGLVDISIDLQNNPERAEAIELLRGWVTVYLVASREHATSEDLSAYIATNALRLTDRPPVVNIKVLLHGLTTPRRPSGTF